MSTLRQSEAVTKVALERLTYDLITADQKRSETVTNAGGASANLRLIRFLGVYNGQIGFGAGFSVGKYSVMPEGEARKIGPTDRIFLAAPTASRMD